MTDRLYSDPDLVQFYDIENEAGMDFDYCVGFARMSARFSISAAAQGNWPSLSPTGAA